MEADQRLVSCHYDGIAGVLIFKGTRGGPRKHNCLTLTALRGAKPSREGLGLPLTHEDEGLHDNVNAMENIVGLARP